ncbi:uncharacterized protein HMPREF1541_07784 [Cyphellophora europaea CBS 101466]|uniref:Uncharacterized protein n=1 Tax=Cyphellophora europaea (strain CBS 101466) TaxID=1220924 RepID=W2RPB2_CYPE1|nr:uncharacterized protein HMPREF1541_07784 [Cyphellophora europaea CBS 101466]ETN38160.1 hypothetical protein HMPREF1541_07784 [Cyphellophora europaea CBS 101466]
MKRQKSRTFISRTISRVKSRISSFGSTTESPNPLIAPPSPSTTLISATPTPRACRTLPPRRTVHGTSIGQNVDRTSREVNRAPPVDGPSDRDEASRWPAVAALELKTSTWTVFGTHAKYPATAYVNFDITCEYHEHVVGNSGGSELHRDSANAKEGGFLMDLTIIPTLTGPGVLLKQYGHVTKKSLSPGERWMLVLHIGIKDTSLASKLSTSFRSLGGRLGKVSNVDVINRWLEVLQKDTAQPELVRPKLLVSARVGFRHSMLPQTTLLIEERMTEVAMTEQEMERARLGGVKLEDVDEEEDEERLREMRVLGAPWL